MTEDEKTPTTFEEAGVSGWIQPSSFDLAAHTDGDYVAYREWTKEGWTSQILKVSFHTQGIFTWKMGDQSGAYGNLLDAKYYGDRALHFFLFGNAGPYGEPPPWAPGTPESPLPPELQPSWALSGLGSSVELARTIGGMEAKIAIVRAVAELMVDGKYTVEEAGRKILDVLDG